MRFAVMISGRGSNLQALIDSCKKGYIKSELALVISSKADAFGVKRAQTAGIKTIIVDPKDYTNKQSVDRDILIQLKNENIDFIVLAGYMRMLTPLFVKKYPKKIVNVHPSLLQISSNNSFIPFKILLTHPQMQGPRPAYIL